MPRLCHGIMINKALINQIMFILIPGELSTGGSGDSATVGSGVIGEFPEFW